MSDWPIHKVGDLEKENLLLVQDGNHGEYRPRKDEFIEQGIAFIRAADLGLGVVQFETAEKINDMAFDRIRKGIGKDLDTVLSTKGTVGKIAFVPAGSPDYVCSPQTSFWRSLDHDFIDPKYLFYEIQSRHFFNQIASRKGETDMADYLSLTSQRGLTIRVPPIDVQREISSVLGSVDEKIELNRQTNQTLEQIAQAIFKSWFVDFDPVRAKIAAREAFIQQHPEVTEDAIRASANTEGDTLAHAGAKACELAAIRAISGKTEEQLNELGNDTLQQLKYSAEAFPDNMANSELGEIPMGWKASSIGEEVAVLGGGTPSTKNVKFWEEGVINWTTPKDLSVTQDKVLVKTDKLITEAGLAKISSGLLPIDTVLMSSRAPVGYLALAKIPVAINQGYIAMKCNKLLSPEFVLLWADSMMDVIKQHASGSTFAEISKKNFRPLSVVVPDSRVLDSFRAIIKPIFDKITETALESSTLVDTRDALLPKLLSGKIVVQR